MRHGTVGGHMLTAYDIERQPDGSRKIFAYDNNRPLTQTELADPSRTTSPRPRTR